MNPAEEADHDIDTKPVKQLAGDVYNELLKHPPDLPHAYKRFAALAAKGFLEVHKAAEESVKLQREVSSFSKEQAIANAASEAATNSLNAKMLSLNEKMATAATWSVGIALGAFILALVALGLQWCSWQHPKNPPKDDPVLAPAALTTSPTTSTPLPSPQPNQPAPQVLE